MSTMSADSVEGKKKVMPTTLLILSLYIHT